MTTATKNNRRVLLTSFTQPAGKTSIIVSVSKLTDAAIPFNSFEHTKFGYRDRAGSLILEFAVENELGEILMNSVIEGHQVPKFLNGLRSALFRTQGAIEKGCVDE